MIARRAVINGGYVKIGVLGAIIDMTQKDKMKYLFESRPNEWIPLYDIFAIAKQYNARIKELRETGMVIWNRTRFVDGEKHSWFMYVPDKVVMGKDGQFSIRV